MQLKRIFELPKAIYDKIAAGEVVDRPVSIVKELVENAIDSGADKIVIEIKNGGKTYIRVSDNGCGIVPDDVALAFKRHATSKINAVSDLDSIETLGFRGEALSSISAVSVTELISRPRDSAGDTGIHVVLEGGEFVENAPIGCSEGTSIIVKDLFYNTPARMKFLKSDNVESRLIIELVSRIALAYPHISFRMINNGNSLFTTNGKGDVISCICTVFSPETGRNLITVKSPADSMERFGMALEAYISPPGINKNNRKSQIFFVNGRSISSKLLEKAVSDGYKEKMFENRYPVVFLFLTVNPEDVDVNIHPSKKEVRFDNDEKVRAFVADIIRRGLYTGRALPEFSLPEKEGNRVSDKSAVSPRQGFDKDKGRQISIRQQSDPAVHEGESAYKISANGGNTDSAVSDLEAPQRTRMSELTKIGTEPISETELREILRSRRKEENLKKAQMEKEAEGRAAAPGSISNAVTKEDGKFSADGADSGAAEDSSSPDKCSRRLRGWCRPDKVSGDFDISKIEAIGTVFATYIIAKDYENMYIIDQHAAHERVFYEQYMAQYFASEKMIQSILQPIMIDAAPALSENPEEWLDFLSDFGFEIRQMGSRSFAVTGIPSHMSIGEARIFVTDFLDSIDEKTDFKDQKRIDKIISKSCKSAVKANNLLTSDEIKGLLKDLAACANPFTCPHGRPTIIKVTRSRLEQLFKR